MDILRSDYYRFLKLLKVEKFFEVEEEKKTLPTLGDIRMLGFPPIYLLLAKKENGLFVAIPLTEEVNLSYLKNTPHFLIKNYRLLLLALPFWIYVHPQILYNYSKKIAETKDILKVLKYAEKTQIPETLQGKYIKKEMERLANINTLSILKYTEELESAETKFFQTISLPPYIKEEISSYAYLFAAKPKKALKGKNWYGIVEDGKLILYLPAEYIGKTIKIYYKDTLLFEGELLEDIFVITDLPLMNDYSILEEALIVQI